MGWEQRGNNHYYYRKERDGSRVKSTYYGRGEIAKMISQIQSSSPLLERIARNIRSPEIIQMEKSDAAVEEATHLIQLVTQATLLAAGFHTHHRQWRRMRQRKG